MWSTCSTISIFIFLLGTLLANDSMIDKDHLTKYPFCGRMSTYRPSRALRSRVVNSGPPEDHYRWVLHIIRQNLNIDDTFSYPVCTGSVITDR